MKTAMVLGAAGGIGSSVLNELIEAGFQSIAVGRDISSLNQIRAHLIEADFSILADVERMVLEVGQYVDAVDFWVYAAGDIQVGKVGEMAMVDWQRVFNSSFLGAHLSLKACLPILAPDAHLFFIGAHVDRLIVPGLSAYTAAKAALESYTAVLEKELHGRFVTLVRPAAVQTDFWQKVPFKKPASAISPEVVARRILSAYDQRLSGLLDL